MIRGNLLKAIALVEAEPEHLLSLRVFERQTTAKGVVHEPIGLLAASGVYLELAFRPGEKVAACFGGSIMLAGASTLAWPDRLDRLFGSNACQRLFVQRGSGSGDADYLDMQVEPVSDKALTLHRLRRQLENYPARAANTTKEQT